MCLRLFSTAPLCLRTVFPGVCRVCFSTGPFELHRVCKFSPAEVRTKLHSKTVARLLMPLLPGRALYRRCARRRTCLVLPHCPLGNGPPGAVFPDTVAVVVGLGILWRLDLDRELLVLLGAADGLPPCLVVLFAEAVEEPRLGSRHFSRLLLHGRLGLEHQSQPRCPWRFDHGLRQVPAHAAEHVDHVLGPLLDLVIGPFP